MSGKERLAGEGLKALAVLALLALVTRAWTFGNPLLHVDDQFYLFAGERLLHGDLPYVDFWDRKPVGLFAIYALAARLFPDPVTGYQLLAWLAVSLTGWTLYAMARRLAPFGAALAGAMAYIAWLPLFGGIGGQAPVFYNLPVALAAMLTQGAVARGGTGRLTGTGCAAMLLTGLALQIKYAAVFEGLFFGLSLLWAGWKGGRPPARLAGDGLLWIGCALAPTLAALLFYWRIGEAWLFLHANFLSVFADDVPFAQGLVRLFWQVLGLMPFWLCGWIALRRWRAPGTPGRREALWALGWAGAAFGGYLAFGNWFDHYVLPLLAPLALVAALAFATVRQRRLAMALVAGLGLAAGQARAFVDTQDRGTARQAAELAALVERHKGQGCIYVTEDIPALYRLTQSCLPTRFVFPEHLLYKRYARALGVGQAGELRRMLARRPSVIVMPRDSDAEYDAPALGELKAGLERDFHPAGAVTTGEETFTVYARNGQ